jgi:hypothetical protein
MLASRALTTNENGTRDFKYPGGECARAQTTPVVLAARPDHDASSVPGGGDVTGGDPALVGKV